MNERRVTAAVVLIGDELLSGRTQDVNLREIARFLAPLGVQVGEARVIADIPEAIVAAVNEVRGRYDYVFTTGGVGPTHDDKTADAIAAAFGVGIDVREDARAVLQLHYKEGDLNDARLKMARIPDGAALIKNPVSRAPGFQIGNVFVLAGVPSVMRGMLGDVGWRIRGGAVVLARTVRGMGVREGEIADELERLEAQAKGVTFGSYPWFSPEGFGVHLVARSADATELDKAVLDLCDLVRARGANPEEVEESR